ncbi:MAG: phosphoglycolate phosphatase [Oceanicoccus sp.]|jgi:phosphoglycolate phosphatase
MPAFLDLFPADQPPAALLFDLDGTLLDSVPDLAAATDAMLAQRQLATVGEVMVRQWVGNGSAMLVQRALAFSKSVAEASLSDDELQQALTQFLVCYQRVNGQQTRLYAGVESALRQWRQQAMPMAVVTNKPLDFVPPLLKQMAIADYFSVLLGGDCVANKKPHPQMLLQCCQQMGLRPEQCLMIGDSRHDVAAARAAAMPVVAVNYGYNHGEAIELAAPDAVIGSFMELL